MTDKMKVFIANRGEIARRIAFTAKRLGYQTATVHRSGHIPAYLSDLIDAWQPVEDLAVSHYLDMSLMVSTAKSLGCTAVHPGFGFLSENADFADAVTKAGLLWVGPHSKAIRVMADKGKAIEAALAADVPCIPGLTSFDFGKEGLKPVEGFAKKSGLPILIKAAMGGGGKGMRVVRDISELAQACERAESEAKKFFGDGRLIVEKYLEDIRHIEVQVLGDKHGQVVILGERDCSAQRRHQKIVEESPAVGLSEEMRQQMYAAAKSLACKVEYDNAGTVEYAVSKNDFYFLEMNTRLQVEHPVTEEVFGLDLVEWQFRIAQNEKINDSLHALVPRGHSIEVRLYAEDVQANFLPAAGPVDAFVPFMGPGIRWEYGLDTVDEVTSGFDPMIAKVVSYGSGRKQAIERLTQALRGSFLAMEKSNVEFLISFLESKIYLSGIYSVNAVSEVAKTSLQKRPNPLFSENEIACIVAELSGANIGQSGEGMERIITGAFASQTFQPVQTNSNAEWQIISKQYTESSFFKRKVSLGKFCWQQKTTGWFAVVDTQGMQRTWLSVQGQNLLISQAKDELTTLESSKQRADAVFSPVPGKVLAIHVKPGVTVALEETMMVLESMKMEFDVKSVASGVIADVLVKVGQQTKAGELLVTYKTEKA